MIDFNTFISTIQCFRELLLLCTSLMQDFDNNLDIHLLKLKHESFKIKLQQLAERVPVSIFEKTDILRHAGWLDRRLSENKPEQCKGDIKLISEHDLFLLERIYIEDYFAKIKSADNLDLLSGLLLELSSNDAEPTSWIMKANSILNKYFPDRKINLNDERLIPADYFSALEKMKFRKIIEAFIFEINLGNPAIMSGWEDIHKIIAEISKPRFDSAHFSDAVEAAFKEINSIIKSEYLKKTKNHEDGDTLMKKSFSPDRPIFHLISRDDPNFKSFQLGYMEIFAGVMKGIRNPKAHANLTITKEDAWDKIVMASHLMKVWDNRIQ